MHLYINIYYLKIKKFKYDPGDTVKTGKSIVAARKNKKQTSALTRPVQQYFLGWRPSRLILLNQKLQLPFQDGLVSLFSLGLLLWITHARPFSFLFSASPLI